MATKIYTAQELREAADFFVRNAEMVRQKVLSNAILANIHDVVPMLRQAAEMRERADAVLAKAKKANETQMSFGCHSCVDNYIKEINYILRGDAGKEEK